MIGNLWWFFFLTFLFSLVGSMYCMGVAATPPTDGINIEWSSVACMLWLDEFLLLGKIRQVWEWIPWLWIRTYNSVVTTVVWSQLRHVRSCCPPHEQAVVLVFGHVVVRMLKCLSMWGAVVLLTNELLSLFLDTLLSGCLGVVSWKLHSNQVIWAGTQRKAIHTRKT